MKTLRLIVLATGMALLLPVTGMAQSADELEQMTREERREYMQGLSAAEREALREEQRARWEALSDEDRHADQRERRERRDQNRAAMRE